MRTIVTYCNVAKRISNFQSVIEWIIVVSKYMLNWKINTIAINVREHVNYFLSLRRFLIHFNFVTLFTFFSFLDLQRETESTVNMMMRQLLGVTALVTIAIMLMQIQSSTACMCMPRHSQSTYCNSDYGKFHRKTTHIVGARSRPTKS